MTAGRFSEVDHDLLAEYAGGALDPARAAQVDRLLRDDPQWQRAYRETVVALAAVTAELAAYGASAPPMPPDVFARLTGVLAEAGPLTTATPAGQESASAADSGRQLGAGGHDGARIGRAADNRPPNRPVGATPATTGRDTRRRRRARLAAPVAVAVVALAVVGLGLGQLRGPGEDAAGTASSAAEVTAPGANRLIASGRDYTAATLPLGVPARRAADVPPGPTEGASLGPDAAPDPADPQPPVGVQTIGSPLERLRGQAALASCLTAVAAEHGGGAVTVVAVDYANFEGAPAVIVEFVDGRGERWAFATGPACGLGSDADVRRRARVG
ncbi:hypothetical protein ACK8GE_04955 [Micromonosporaceae bacterium DT194]|uniref:hypothetical protein n=1 Tax=Melissospora conviva TaxID=3388432 RepID=UPI003C17D0E4